MATSPEHGVLFTTELLELILLSLDPKDVIALHRVCRQWKNTIAGSVKLQHTLFLRPIAEVVEDPEKDFVLNPMLATVSDTVISHLILAEFIPASDMHKADRHANKPALNKEASFRRMLLTQPPFQTLTTESFVSDIEYGRTFNKHGITLDDFFEHCDDIAGVCPDTWFTKPLERFFTKFERYEQLAKLSKRSKQ